jgi:hypothetical protein
VPPTTKHTRTHAHTHTRTHAHTHTRTHAHTHTRTHAHTLQRRARRQRSTRMVRCQGRAKRPLPQGRRNQEWCSAADVRTGRGTVRALSRPHAGAVRWPIPGFTNVGSNVTSAPKAATAAASTRNPTAAPTGPHAPGRRGSGRVSVLAAVGAPHGVPAVVELGGLRKLRQRLRPRREPRLRRRHHRGLGGWVGVRRVAVPRHPARAPSGHSQGGWRKRRGVGRRHPGRRVRPKPTGQGPRAGHCHRTGAGAGASRRRGQSGGSCGPGLPRRGGGQLRAPANHRHPRPQAVAGRCVHRAAARSRPCVTAAGRVPVTTAATAATAATGGWRVRGERWWRRRGGGRGGAVALPKCGYQGRRHNATAPAGRRSHSDVAPPAETPQLAVRATRAEGSGCSRSGQSRGRP